MSDLEHLTLVNGLPLEKIESKLKEAGIRYDVFGNIPVDFFREHIVRTDYPFDPKREKVSKTEIIKLLGRPPRHQGRNLYYYAKYEVGDCFDFSKLNGKITFDRGLLVERTKVYCGHR